MKPKNDLVRFNKLGKKPLVFSIGIYSSKSNVIEEVNKLFKITETFIPNGFGLDNDLLSGSLYWAVELFFGAMNGSCKGLEEIKWTRGTWE